MKAAKSGQRFSQTEFVSNKERSILPGQPRIWSKRAFDVPNHAKKKWGHFPGCRQKKVGEQVKTSCLDISAHGPDAGTPLVVEFLPHNSPGYVGYFAGTFVFIRPVEKRRHGKRQTSFQGDGMENSENEV